jgi:hypothetical protein
MMTEAELLELRKLAFMKRKYPLAVVQKNLNKLRSLMSSHLDKPFASDSHDVRDAMASLNENIGDLLIYDLRISILTDVIGKKEKK